MDELIFLFQDAGFFNALVLVGILIFGAAFFFIRKKSAPKPLESAKPLEFPKVSDATKAQTAPEPVSDNTRVLRGLTRTKAFFQTALDRVFSGAQGEKFFEDLEEALLTADVGIEYAENVTKELRASLGVTLPAREKIREELKGVLLSRLPRNPIVLSNGHAFATQDKEPYVVMIVGINGAGKTTTIAKLCQRFISQGKKVLVGAADTFRAAATEQLKTWVERVGADGVFQKEGSDPSAVAFDSVQAAKSRAVDLCLIDTAGRLHTKTNLMEELKKMKRVIGKALGKDGPHAVWLVLDGSTGQNALIQAREFHQHLGLTGIVVTKLDGSAKGGALLSIATELKVPVVFVGVGEAPEDLVPFDPSQYVDAILAGV